jgi:hypothetical protein
MFLYVESNLQSRGALWAWHDNHAGVDFVQFASVYVSLGASTN